MPTYDYECKGCGHSFDVFQGMTDEPLTLCPECGKKQLRRLIGGGVGIIFKGSGFYVTDSKSKSSSATATAGKETASKESSTKEPAAKSTDSTAASSTGESKPAKNGSDGGTGNRSKSAAAT
ncbi:MAG: zinc ribbon domain-containing protein [Spirochaetaceae bacterium]|nr:MAG: zinc ribbon domain-containing protein [Spirochaetaceae bacterium]